jgi:hypothetical protein
MVQDTAVLNRLVAPQSWVGMWDEIPEDIEMRICFRDTVQNRGKNKPKPNPEKSAPTDGFDVTQEERGPQGNQSDFYNQSHGAQVAP